MASVHLLVNWTHSVLWDFPSHQSFVSFKAFHIAPVVIMTYQNMVCSKCKQCFCKSINHLIQVSFLFFPSVSGSKQKEITKCLLNFIIICTKCLYFISCWGFSSDLDEFDGLLVQKNDNVFSFLFIASLVFHQRAP